MSAWPESEETAVQKLANYAASLTFDDLPELAVIRARQVVLDYLATALGGYRTDLGQRMADFAARMRPGVEASIIGSGRCSSLYGAAWANAAICCIPGMTETHRLCGHAASELVPVALAIGEHLHLDGQRLITALAAGYEIFGAIQPAVRAPQRIRGLDHKSQVGTLASAITAGVALGLDAARLGHALALAADMACGTEQYAFDAGKCDTEGLLAGYAAANGISAAQLADFGFHGPPGALDGPYGYFHAFGGGFRPEYLHGLGQPTMLASAAFKPHSGCRCVHAGVDAAIDVTRKGQPPLGDIVSIEVATYKDAVTPEFRLNVNPDNPDAAAYSLPIAVATILVRGNWYREDIEAFHDPEIQRLAHLTHCYVDEDIEADYPRTMGCVVRVATSQGTTHEGRVQYPKGEPENMLTDAEFEYKLRRLAADLLPDRQLNSILRITGMLERSPDVAELVALTVPVADGSERT